LVNPAEKINVINIAHENRLFLKVDTRMSGSRDFFSRWYCQNRKEVMNITATMRIAITKGVFHPRETPSERAISRRRAPDVNKKAPIQSTPEAFGSLGSRSFAALGMTKNAVTPVAKAAPAIT